jgi:hypothetical protein
MARFNLEDYETVESRIKKFYEIHPDGRIITEWVNEYAEVTAKMTWVVKTSVYLSAGELANKLPKATGLASEVDGTGGANLTSALENAETSSIGRALANMALSGNKRASREEMQKVERVAQHATEDWLAKADKLSDVEALRMLWAQAKAANADTEILDRIKTRANTLGSAGGLLGGIEGSLPGLLEEDAGSGTRGSVAEGRVTPPRK